MECQDVLTFLGFFIFFCSKNISNSDLQPSQSDKGQVLLNLFYLDFISFGYRYTFSYVRLGVYSLFNLLSYLNYTPKLSNRDKLPVFSGIIFDVQLLLIKVKSHSSREQLSHLKLKVSPANLSANLGKRV